jgi:hypothetical protein
MRVQNGTIPRSIQARGKADGGRDSSQVRSPLRFLHWTLVDFALHVNTHWAGIRVHVAPSQNNPSRAPPCQT